MAITETQIPTSHRLHPGFGPSKRMATNKALRAPGSVNGIPTVDLSNKLEAAHQANTPEHQTQEYRAGVQGARLLIQDMQRNS